jgi:hypothetical protein
MLLLFSVISPNRGSAQWPYSFEFIRVGDVSLNIYVVCLDEVDAHGVENVSEIVEGVYRAARIPAHSSEQPENGIIWFRSGFSSEPTFTYYGVKVNVSVTAVRNWSLYRNIIEEGSNSIVVNAHGETLPVPGGYTKEDWLDMVASAMAERNMTWVHTTWYPFYYYQPQGGLEEEWGEEGFKRLMNYTGKDNITCLTHWDNHGERDKTPLTFEAYWTIREVWSFDQALDVELGRPLRASDFKNYTAMPIWGYTAAYLTGAVIKFAHAPNATSSFGFYVHIGTNQTFDEDGNPTSRCDYWRGYAGAAAAIWTASLRNVAEKHVFDARQAISKAENEGRTKGLDKAQKLLLKAESYFTGESGFHSYDDAIVLAMMAKESTEQATKPSFTEIYGLQITIGAGAITAIMIITGTVMMVQRRNSKNKAKDK